MNFLLETIEFPHPKRMGNRRYPQPITTRIFGVGGVIITLMFYYVRLIDHGEIEIFLELLVPPFDITKAKFVLDVWWLSMLGWLSALGIIFRYPRWAAYSLYTYFSLFTLAMVVFASLGLLEFPSRMERSDLVIAYSLLAITLIASPAILIIRQLRYRRKLGQ